MTHLKPGDPAPAFSANNQDGHRVTLENFAGKSLILFFYPKDDTPGCTKEVCNFRDNFDTLREHGYEIVGVSADDEQSHLRFIDKFDLPFTLLADTERKIVKDYGVWGEKSNYGRKYMGIHRLTFVIDPQGVIKSVITKVTPDESAEQILALQA